jgi:hypothetical protein
MRRMIGRILSVGLLLLMLGVMPVEAQSSAQGVSQEYTEGQLNVWTTKRVLREDMGGGDFLRMRVGKHDGFDRVVFEMNGTLPKWYVTYEKPPFETYGDQYIKLRGKAFIHVSLYMVGYSDEDRKANEKLERRQNKMNWPMIREVKTSSFFEGEIEYLIGLKKRTPFRVLALSNPTRLVVDFKQ